jgi:hypothetical protein
MKRSTTPTSHIFILADTASEWDNCDFAILELTEEWRSKMRLRLNALERFDADDEFCGIRYWDSSLELYQNPEDEGNGLPKDMLEDGEVWCYIILEDGEPDSFKVPESWLSASMLTIYAYGTAVYSASGKHTGEEFWTKGFDVDQLIVSRPDNNTLLTLKNRII